jgi:trehalose 6-phosphate synthase
LEKPAVQSRIAELEKRFAGVKLIVGVDRLDYIKGVPQKLHALEVFLTQHPEWIGKVHDNFIPLLYAFASRPGSFLVAV